MNLLSPFFLVGLAMIAGPIIAHLIRRATKDRLEFSAIRFLKPSTPRLDRRSRVQHPLLLLLRCLIVATLALAFARPFWTQTTPPVASEQQPRIVLALLDRSASMQASPRWSDAVTRVESIVAELDPKTTTNAEAGLHMLGSGGGLAASAGRPATPDAEEQT